LKGEVIPPRTFFSFTTELLTLDALIACQECDLLVRLGDIPTGAKARCPRCGAFLWQHKVDSINRSLAMAAGALVLFVLANSFPFLALKLEGLSRQTTLLTGIQELYRGGMWEIALLVFMTTLVIPLIQITGLLYILLPLRFGFVPPRAGSVFRLVRHIQPWGMLEVFSLGILVALVKLADLADIIPGTALWSFAGLMIILTASISWLDPHEVWSRLEIRP